MSRRTRVAGLALGLTAASTLLIGVSVAPAGAFDGLRAPWHHDDDWADVREDDDHEEESCVAPSATTTPTTAASSSGSSLSQTVTVVVPPIVRVHADHDGKLTVISNAARPPAAGDLVYVRQADTGYVPADAAMVQRVLSATWADTSWCSTTAEHTSIG